MVRRGADWYLLWLPPIIVSAAAGFFILLDHWTW